MVTVLIYTKIGNPSWWSPDFITVLSEWVSEWASEWVSDWVIEWVSEWVSEYANIQLILVLTVLSHSLFLYRTIRKDPNWQSVVSGGEFKDVLTTVAHLVSYREVTHVRHHPKLCQLKRWGCSPRGSTGPPTSTHVYAHWTDPLSSVIGPSRKPMV